MGERRNEMGFEGPDDEVGIRLSRFLDGEEPVAAEVERLLAEDAALRAQHGALEATDRLLRDAFRPGRHPFDSRLARRIVQDLPANPRRVIPFPKWVAWCGAAAALVVLALTVTFWWNRKPGVGSPERPSSTLAQIEARGGQIAVERGEETFVSGGSPVTLLPGDRIHNRSHEAASIESQDGSRIYLASGTRVALLDRDGLTVQILGEGRVYCEVEKQAPGRTFRVLAERLEVQVVGTRFLVQDGAEGDENGGSTIVRVLEGRVRCVSRRGTENLVLGRFQRAILDVGGDLWSEPDEAILDGLRWLPHHADLVLEDRASRPGTSDPAPQDPTIRDPAHRPGGVKVIDGMDGPVTPPEKKD